MSPCRLAALLVLVSALGAMAETHSVSAQGRGGERHARQVESFDGPWRVHAGDDPQGASPTQDDSAWQQVELGSTESKNLSTAEGVLWFRALIPWQNIPANFALLIAPKATGCQIFVNGSKVSDCSRLPGPNYYTQRGILIHLTAASPGSPSLLAIRLDQPGKTRSGAVGLGKGDVLLGTSALLSDRRTALDAARFYRFLPQVLLCLGELLGGAVLLLAFAFDRGSREYLWFAAFLWLDGSTSLMSCFDVVYPIVGPGWQRWLNEFGQIARYAPLIGFLAAFTNVRMNWALRGYQVILLLVPEVLAAASFYGLGRYLPNFAYVLLAVQLPFVAGSLVFLAMQWRRGSRDAALLLPSFLLANGFEVLGLTGLVGRFHLGPRFSYDCDDLSMFFFLISIAPVMIARHRRITMEHARTNADLEAAREVQRQFVVPAADVPGFRVESAYAPAKQVGGDFFRVMPEDGGVLVVVGDVSGKGLKAAMTVSAIMGSLHDYASSRPAEVLAHLNRVLHGRMDGFVTCCAAHITANGTMTLANAGNPAPYLNGEEMAVEPGLPLGILGEASYAETRYEIAPNDRLTFVSDGVVEATNPQGELYGFERTEAISNQPAKAIAEAATQFGQEDDITVLSVTRTVSLNPALA
ncbi:MAG: SpoIIE family protein phosphatase [Acidobacteriaceae bacterium]